MALSLVGYGSVQNDLQTSPIAEPLTLAQAKQQVRREDVDTDDAYLEETLIPAARERGEFETARQFISTTWDLKLDRFPCPDDLSPWEQRWYPQGVLRVPKPPLQSVVSISYVDPDGATQTWASNQYVVDAPDGPTAARGRIVPVYGVSWPTTREQINAVTVRFVAGYGDSAAAVPPRLRMGMLEDLGTLYEHREDFVVGQGYAITPFPLGSSAIYRAFKSY
jgi:uncharacterized phiE125 gp8 family phage protein